MTHSLTIVTHMRKSLAISMTLAAFITIGAISANAQSTADEPLRDSLAATDDAGAPEASHDDDLSHTSAEDAPATQQNLDIVEVDEVPLEAPIDTSEGDLNVEEEPGLPSGAFQTISARWFNPDIGYCPPPL